MKDFFDWYMSTVVTTVIRSDANKRERARQQRGGRKKKQKKNAGAWNANPAWWTIQDGSLLASTVLWTVESLKKERDE